MARKLAPEIQSGNSYGQHVPIQNDYSPIHLGHKRLCPFIAFAGTLLTYQAGVLH